MLGKDKVVILIQIKILNVQRIWIAIIDHF
jgi:hypothetical protein